MKAKGTGFIFELASFFRDKKKDISEDLESLLAVASKEAGKWHNSAQSR